MNVRVIPRIDIRNENVIKGVHLEGVRRVGLPAKLVKQYASDGADEIIFMDVVASLYGRSKILPVVETAARDVFIPLTVGGGIRSIEDIGDVLRSGADKVAINTAAIERPDFLREAARAFGSQCIVVSIEAKRNETGWEAMTNNGREHSRRQVVDWAVEAQELGAGELLVTSVDQEGTRQGFDLELFRKVHSSVKIPVIGCGGAGTVDHVVSAARAGVADALCCASIFHFKLAPIEEVKSALIRAGIEVRP